MRIVTFESVETLTQAEFADWISARLDDRNQYELLNGRIVMNPPAGWPYGEGEADVLAPIHQLVRRRDLGRVFGPSQGFELPSGDTVAPDVAFVSKERWLSVSAKVGKFLRVVPDLVVEVLSPGTASRDRGEKKLLHERNGVREYWLVDVPRRQDHHVPPGGRTVRRRDHLRRGERHRFGGPGRAAAAGRGASTPPLIGRGEATASGRPALPAPARTGRAAA